MIARARQSYGASPWHLVGHVLALAVMVYAVSRVLDPRFSRGLNVLVWLVGGAIVHDLVLVPAYSALDGVARRVARRMGPSGRRLGSRGRPAPRLANPRRAARRRSRAPAAAPG